MSVSGDDGGPRENRARGFPPRAAMIALVSLAAFAGCGGDDAAPESAEEETAQGDRPARSGGLELDRTLPPLEVTPIGHHESLLEARRWTVLVLVPPACGDCPDDLDAWLLEADVAAGLGLRVAIVAEGDASSLRWLDPAAGSDGPARVFATVVPIFRATRELSRPTFALVDTAGIVRFIGRQSGTVEERWLSVTRNHHYQAAPDSLREDLVRGAFSRAERVELARTAQTEWLGQEIAALGLSPWYGTVYGPGDRLLGLALPIERDTDCNTCDPLYLMVGLEVHGRVLSISEIEPVVSLGKRESTHMFFQALKGVNDPDQVARVTMMLESPKADRATREILTVAFRVAERWMRHRKGAPGGSGERDHGDDDRRQEAG